MKKLIALALTVVCWTAQGNLLLTSPTGYGKLHSSIPDFGGAVIDIVGKNNNRVLSFISERELAHTTIVTSVDGYASTNIGTLSFTDVMLNALIGGIDHLAIRLTLWDGDNSLLNGSKQGFQANQNFLYTNGERVENFSNVETIAFERFGVNTLSTPGVTGFIADQTSVGWFSIDQNYILDSLYRSIFDTRKLAFDFVIEGARPEQRNFISFSDKDARLTDQVKSFDIVKVSEPKTFPFILVFLMGLALNYFYQKRTSLTIRS